MSIVKKEVEVSDGADKAVAGMVDMVNVVKAALADGWQLGTDVPVVVLAAIKDFAPVVASLGSVAEDAKANRAAVLRAVGLGVTDLADALLPKA